MALAILLTRAVSFMLLVTGASGQTRVPRFKDHPVAEVYTGPTASLALTRRDRMFRTRLREAAQGRPNFAGHYIVTTWGCGASCVTGAVIDAKTGRVFWLPHTTCCWGFGVDENFAPVEFRPDSKLIIFSGARDEKDGDEGTHFYRFEQGRFEFLRTVKKK